MASLPSLDEPRTRLREDLQRLRGDSHTPPRASIVVPVNAQKDLFNVFALASDIAADRDHQPIEFILVVNNYPADNPPREIEEYQQLGFNVLAVPKVEHKGGVALAARMPGIEAAQSENLLLFDADCRVPNSTALIDWYLHQLDLGIDLAYTHVDYLDLPAGMAIKARMLIHHAARWYKRVLLGIPTSRGSNYAMKRTLILALFAQGRIHYDIHIGPAVKSMNGKIAYSEAKEHVVFTSGRFFSNSWKELLLYLVWRVGYYLRVRPAKPAAPSFDR